MKKKVIWLCVVSVITIIVWLLFVDTKKSIPVDSGPTVIAIQPFAKIQKREIDSVKIAIERMYGIEVVVLENIPLPDTAFTTVRYPRYRADTLLHWLSATKSDTIDIIVGVTNKDISITKYKLGTKEIKEPVAQYRDFGIFGLGSVGGNACVISSNRLHKKVSTKKFYKRLMRITNHEVGHVLGLRHCPTLNCLMNDANESIKTIDKSTGELCVNCWNKIN